MRRPFISALLAASIAAAMPFCAVAQIDLPQTDLPQADLPHTDLPQAQQDVFVQEGPSQQELYEAYLKDKAAFQIEDADLLNAESIPAPAAANQERCITIMSGFPDSGPLPRYQFFKLSEDLAVDVTPEFRAALSEFGDGDVADETPILDVIETIANPVLRQAAPEIIVANMAHLIGFAQDCDTYLTGQIQSLRAVDNSLSQDDIIIAEDALYLRQILSDSMSRLGADTDYIHGAAVNDYASSLIISRDNIEFAGFDADVEDLEALYLTDLDGRLARSNDVINSEINQEILGDAVVLSRDLSEASNEQERQRSLITLLRILGGGR